MSARSRLTRREIHGVLRALRNLNRRDRCGGEVVAGPGEILIADEDKDFRRDSTTDDTRVRTAVAWLEEAQLLSRNEKHVRVFPSSLRVSSLEEVRQRLQDKPIDDGYRRCLTDIAEALINDEHRLRRLTERALLWLHEQEVVRLNRGLTVFRPAMTIVLDPDRRGFRQSDYKSLALHDGIVHRMAGRGGPRRPPAPERIAAVDRAPSQGTGVRPHGRPRRRLGPHQPKRGPRRPKRTVASTSGTRPSRPINVAAANKPASATQSDT